MKRFEIPEIPHERILKAKLKHQKIWDGIGWDLADPAMTITWDDPDHDKDGFVSEPKRMVEDPEYDLAVQLKSVRRKIEMLEAGSDGPGSIPCLNLIHFGTGPVATAFGAKMVMQTGIQPHFDPAIHTPEEALAVEKPDLARGGWLGAILDRSEYYNEMTDGKIPITISDNAGPWSIATSVWHYEDMLEALLTCPEAVHHLVKLCTDAIIEVDEMQIEVARNAWGIIGDTGGGSWMPRGAGVGDDVLVTVSPQMWKEFFQPYNEIISNRYGGIVYHCCMKHERHLHVMAETKGFMGFDADPLYNSHDIIESALTGKGVWNRVVTDWDLARRFKGKFGMFLGAHGKTKEEAIENSRKMMDYIHK